MSQWTECRSQQAARAQKQTQRPAQHPSHYPAQADAHHSGHHAAQHARPDASRRGEPCQRGMRETAGAGYTIAHAGRQVRFGPVVFWIAVGTVVIMASWSVAAATYLAFRDDVLRSLIAHQAEQQFAYEDRIAELRAQIDRTKIGRAHV